MDKVLQFPIPAYIVWFIPESLDLFLCKGELVDKQAGVFVYTISDILWGGIELSFEPPMNSPVRVGSSSHIFYDLLSATQFMTLCLNDTKNALAGLVRDWDSRVDDLIDQIYVARQNRFSNQLKLKMLEGVRLPTVKELYEKI